MLKGQHVTLLGTELLFAEATGACLAPAFDASVERRIPVYSRMRLSEEHVDKGKKPLVHVANTERRIRFHEVELRPKQDGDASQATPSTIAKSSSVARKVQTQMDHVMSGSAGPTRRGRGGRKRGLTRPKGKGRELVEEPADQSEDMTVGAGSASVEMDTS